MTIKQSVTRAGLSQYYCTLHFIDVDNVHQHQSFYCNQKVLLECYSPPVSSGDVGDLGNIGEENINLKI